ncbi:hypothetical protein [Actinacidiphila acididurans]|nr:hypothetical protein [Actinacidiphila acididurans]
MYAAVQQIVNSRPKPPATWADILGSLEKDGLVASVAALRSM